MFRWKKTHLNGMSFKFCMTTNLIKFALIGFPSKSYYIFFFWLKKKSYCAGAYFQKHGFLSHSNKL